MKINDIAQQELREKKHFDTYAALYDNNYNYNDKFTKYKITKKSRELIEFIKKHKGNKKLNILELGCGTGEYTKIIAPQLPKSQFYCIDISSAILNVAKKKCKGIKNVKFIKKSAYKTGFNDKYFDVIYGYYILHHLDLNKVSKEINRVLKKGGIGFFYEPNILNPYVFLVKSVPFIKKKIGDSPDEWALNALTIGNIFKKEKVKVKTSEFIFPIKRLNLGTMKKIDTFTSGISNLPVFKYLGGSLQISLIK